MSGMQSKITLYTKYQKKNVTHFQMKNRSIADNHNVT